MVFSSALTDALRYLADRVETAVESQHILPSEWIERHFYVPEPRDIRTGKTLLPGPIRLAEHQRRIINEALSRDAEGYFKYTTIIYSAPKKSGKSALSAAVGLYLADRLPYSRVYCLANDGKQSNDRLYGPIRTCIQLHRKLGGRFADVKPYDTEVTLPNSTKIESIPCDAAGEAGAEPTVTLWSEIWGFDTEAKKRLWTEMTVPPTKFGRAVRWVETYAGFVGVSTLLEQLYQSAVIEGTRHPDFPDLPVYVNQPARIFCYWDTEPRMVWQTPEYYAAEAKLLTPSEFQRVHRNQWVSPIGRFIEPEMWQACKDDSLQPLSSSRTPVVIGVDAATEGDCAALVAVTRDPRHPQTDVAVRAVRIFKPQHGKSLVLEETVGSVIKDWCSRWNVVCVVYDAFQMEKLVQDYRRGYVVLTEHEKLGLSAEQQEERLKELKRAVGVWYYKFSQQTARAVADKMLYDMILTRRLHWNDAVEGDIYSPDGRVETLSKHVLQAGSSSNRGQLRLVKQSNELKIDAAVALSMAVSKCLELNLYNSEQGVE